MGARKTKKWKTNPFLNLLLEDSETKLQKVTSPLKKDDLLLVSRAKGEIPTDANIGIIYSRKVERNEFVKVYVSGIAALFGLSKAGQKVFTLLYSELSGKESKDKDIVTLYYPALPEEVRTKISYRVFTKGINDLIQTGFIAESIMPSQFYINPTYMFNGDRLALMNIYEVKKSKRKVIDEVKEQENITRGLSNSMLNPPF